MVMVSLQNNENENAINDAIFVGLLGIVFVFLSFEQANLILKENILPIEIVIVLFTFVAFIRMLEILLDGKKTEKYSVHVFRILVLPAMCWTGPTIILMQISNSIQSTILAAFLSYYFLAWSVIYLFKKYIVPYFLWD